MGEGDVEDVGPFFEFFTEVGVVEDRVDCAVPATRLHLSPHISEPEIPAKKLRKGRGVTYSIILGLAPV